MKNNENNKLNQNSLRLLFALDGCYYKGNIFQFGLKSYMIALFSVKTTDVKNKLCTIQCQD